MEKENIPLPAVLDVLLEWHKLVYDVLFVQEPPWRLIRSAPSAVSVEGEEVVGAPNHPSWLAMVRPPDPDMHPRVMAYVSTRLSAWRPSMRRDIIDHRDVLVLSLFAEGHTFNFMNVYSDNEFTAIRLLAARADTLPQFHYMGGDFNCHSSAWDPVPRPANVAASHWLLEAAATIGLELGTVSNPGPTHIPRDASKRPSVIDLVFLPVALSASVSTERVIQNMLDSDHIPLLTHVPVSPAVRTALRRCLPSDPEKVQAFLDDLVAKLRLIVPDDVAETPDDVEAAASAVASAFSEAWLAHSRDSNVTRRSNPWWNEACATALQQHRASRDPADWAHFRRTVKEAKRVFFDAQIAEIAVKSKRPWDLMNWVQQRKLPPCEAIQYQGQPCHEMSALWDALHGTYNAASGRACDMTVLDPLPDAPTRGNTMPPKAKGVAPDPPGSRAASSSNIPRPGTAGPAPATSSPDPSGATSAREYYSTPTPGVPLRIRSATTSRVASRASSPIRTATAAQESSPAPGSPDSEEEAEDEPMSGDTPTSTPAPAYLALTDSADAAELDFSAITAALSSAHTWLVSNSEYDDTAHNNRLFTQRLYNLVDTAISAGFGGVPTWDDETLQHAFEGLFSPPTIPTSTQDVAPTSSAPPPPPPAASRLQDVDTVMADASAPPQGPNTGKGKSVDRPPPKQTPKPAPASKPIAARYKKPPPPPTIARPPRRSYAAAARDIAPAPLPRAAAPAHVATPAARKRGKKVTPAYTRTGPSRRGIMVTFQAEAPTASLSILVARINAALKNSRSSLVIDSARVAFSGWVLAASNVPSEAELNTVRLVIYSVCANHSDPKPWVGLPASTSYLRIMGAPYFNDRTGTVRMQPSDFETKLLAAPFRDLVQLSGPPRIVRDSRTAWTCTVYFNIHDSQTGARASQLIKRELMFGNVVCPIQGTRANSGTPHCMRCHRWGHPTTACMARATVCAHCAGPHNEDNHREAAACCQAKPKANPPVPATAAGAPCPHSPHCVNCGGDHLATARKCVFFRNRFDREWITARYAQEPPWRLIRSAPSAVSVEGEEVVGAPNHPSWLAMVRPPDPDMHPRVMAYVSTRLSAWRPSMRRDIIDHRDVLVLSLFAEGHTFNFMNVYSDNEFTAIRLLAARADTLPQFHYMGGDFNCHSSAWDPVPRPANVAASHWLLEAAATIGLELGTVSNPGPTHIPRDASKRPSVIDLVFLPVALSASVSTERVIQNMLDSDHIPLLTHVPVSPAVRTALRRCLPSDPEKVQAFLDDLVAKLRLIVPDDVAETPDDVEAAASAVASAFSEAWLAHSRDSNVTRRSNPWWNEACATALQQHRASRDPADWAHFRRTVKEAKRVFFDAQIAEIAVKSKRPWDLMNWVQQRKLPPCEAIQYQGQPCHEMSALWDALHGTYNAASGHLLQGRTT
ncbi:hypothetical protein D9619_010814 [Psilocybe cf. subviscida]|uniref:Endonuclease/exonuclease/phosphatase domain-containing protein n=1 Tax=Psilocybe cf. subviscida TaxID=2480587 RepID=A0A8H5EZW8_9AGAR|nr:hypothetical protein D9619_010814 [Psilocybe cf. subviscida]